jgi:transposase
MPYVLPRAPQGRRIADLRSRMDAIFHLASTPGHPWRDLPAQYGKPDTVARFFRRLTHAGLWHRLLQALRECGPKHPLRSLEYAICRATRRAARLGGMNLLLLIRRLDLRSALNGPPWLLPNPFCPKCSPAPRYPRRHAPAFNSKRRRTISKVLQPSPKPPLAHGAFPAPSAWLGPDHDPSPHPRRPSTPCPAPG